MRAELGGVGARVRWEGGERGVRIGIPYLDRAIP